MITAFAAPELKDFVLYIFVIVGVAAAAIFGADYAYSRRQKRQLQEGETPKGVDGKKVRIAKATTTAQSKHNADVVGPGAGGMFSQGPFGG